MMIQTSVTHLLRALMTRSNEWSNGNKWAMHIRAPIGNTLVVGYKCRNSLTIRAKNNYKRKKWHNPKVHTKIHPKTNLSQFLSINLFFFWLNHRSIFEKHHTSVIPFHFKSYYKFQIEDIINPTSSIYRDEELNCWFLASSVRRRLWGH